jgi:methylated-DNA-protein-cysteine methyltransferase-like protein
MPRNRDDVPAHRVVNRNGLRKFHFDGTNLMQQLLESEGIEVVENQIVNLKTFFGNQKSSFSIPLMLSDKLASFLYQ